MANGAFAPSKHPSPRSPSPDYTLISADDIARSNRQSVIDLLQAQRGIEVARNGGPGTNASVFIRGADGKQNIVLVDGVRIGSTGSSRPTSRKWWQP